MTKVYWITGCKNAGKTTLAYEISDYHYEWNMCNVVLDGDEVRALFPTGFTDNNRFENIMRIIKTAKLLQDQEITAIVAAVTPYVEMRDLVRESFGDSLRLIYIPGGELWEGTTYDIPPEEHIYATYKWDMDVQEIL